MSYNYIVMFILFLFIFLIYNYLKRNKKKENNLDIPLGDNPEKAYFLLMKKVEKYLTEKELEKKNEILNRIKIDIKDYKNKFADSKHINDIIKIEKKICN